MHEFLTDNNFLLYCAKHYEQKHFVDDEEFYDDLNRIKYIKKLITKYLQTGELKERLILNHIIVLNNVFGPYHASRIIYLKLKHVFPQIKPFLILLNILPENFINIETELSIVYTDDIPLDPIVVEKLRQI